MIYMQKFKLSFVVASMVTLFGVVTINSAVAEISAETSLTVMNVTENKLAGGASDLTTWPTWPTGPDHALAPDSNGDLKLDPNGKGLYLNKVSISAHYMSWNTTPYFTPYRQAANGLNSYIAAVWSVDEGRTFKAISWDYLAPTSHSKGLHTLASDCWVGVIVHSFHDYSHNRSNVFFTEAPEANPDDICWGVKVMQ